MKSYLLIQSQSALNGHDAAHFFSLATDLARRGETVEVLLVQNAVMAAREGAKAESLRGAIKSGVAVLADDFAMKERALPRNQLRHGIEAVSLTRVVERMAQGWNIIWH